MPPTAPAAASEAAKAPAQGHAVLTPAVRGDVRAAIRIRCRWLARSRRRPAAGSEASVDRGGRRRDLDGRLLSTVCCHTRHDSMTASHSASASRFQRARRCAPQLRLAVVANGTRGTGTLLPSLTGSAQAAGCLQCARSVYTETKSKGARGPTKRSGRAHVYCARVGVSGAEALSVGVAAVR